MAVTVSYDVLVSSLQSYVESPNSRLFRKDGAQSEVNLRSLDRPKKSVRTAMA